MQENQTVLETAIITEQSRKRKLADYIRMSCAKGWIVESQNDFNAVLFSGKKCNHTLWALITFLGGIVSFGLLFIIGGITWLILAIAQGEKRIMLHIDEFGEIITQKL